PQELPEIPGLKAAASYRTLGDAGGDLYDFVPLGQRVGSDGTDHRWAVLIGDVSGHGASAAVVMAMLHSILHAFPHRPVGPAEVLTYANKHLCAKRIGNVFATCILCFYDPDTRALTYARAGHPPAILAAGNGSDSRRLEEAGDLP